MRLNCILPRGQITFYISNPSCCGGHSGLAFKTTVAHKSDCASMVELVMAQTFKEKAILRKQRRITYFLCHRCGCQLPADWDKRTCSTCLVGRKTKYEEYRQLVFDHYGDACSCCGRMGKEFLAIDHMPGTPRPPEQKTRLTEWIVENNFPEGFRILCHCCNMATRYGRTCPHQLGNKT